MDELLGITVGVSIFLVVVLGVPLLVGNAVSKHFTMSNCEGFARETQRETRYAEYNYWNYECLAKTTDGKWLPSDQLRELTD